MRTAPGITWELAELRRRTISEISYDVRLQVPADRAVPLEGETVVRFAWDDVRRRDVVLDFLEPAARVRSVAANGRAVAWRPENDHVVIPSAALRSGAPNEVRVVYNAGDEALNRSEDFLYTLFVPERQHFSLPVFDQPDLKGRWRLTLEVPPRWVAVSNGVEEARPAGGRVGTSAAVPARQLYSFAETPPIPSYLFAFAAGRLQVEVMEREGRRLRMYHRETDAMRVARNHQQIFGLHQRALDWMEEYTGIPYPFEKLDFVLVPSFQFGGMEHPGAILYRQDALLLDESATQGDHLARASVIAHETAQMWFGDLVTMSWFDDVWTKEVFANLMAAKIVRPSFPELDHGVQFLLAHHPAAYAVDRSAGTHPIRQPLENLRDAGSLYGSIIYEKAPIVMRQLEELVGEDAFRDGLRDYLTTYAYGNAGWADLIEILDRRTSHDLRAWSRSWLDEAGRPTVLVRREANTTGARLTLWQEDPAGRGRVWPQTLRVAWPGSEGIELHAVELGDAPVSLDLAGDEPAWILPNGGGHEYGRFVLDGASRDALLGGESEIVEARLRAAVWIVLWDAVLEGEIAPTRFLEQLLAHLPTEPDEQIAQLLLGYLETAHWRLLTGVERGRRGPAVELVLWKGAREAPSPTLRAAYFRTWQSLVQTPEGVTRLRRLWVGAESPPVPLSEPDRTRLAESLALLEVSGWRQLLERAEAAIENPDRRARFAFLRPALSADPADRERFFLSLASAANREREPWVLDGLAYLNHPLRAEHARRFIRPALELLEEVQRTGDVFFPGRWIAVTLSGHNHLEAAAAVRAFLEERPDYPARLRGKILQASDLLERSARIVHGWSG